MKVKTLVATRRRLPGGEDEPAKFEDIPANVVVDLDDDHATALIARGSASAAAVPAEEVEAPKPKVEVTTEAPVKKVAAPKRKDDRLSKIQAAALDLSQDNPGHFTEDGLPQVEALEALLGWAPKAAERDEAWAALQA